MSESMMPWLNTELSAHDRAKAKELSKRFGQRGKFRFWIKLKHNHNGDFFIPATLTITWEGFLVASGHFTSQSSAEERTLFCHIEEVAFTVQRTLKVR